MENAKLTVFSEQYYGHQQLAENGQRLAAIEASVGLDAAAQTYVKRLRTTMENQKAILRKGIEYMDAKTADVLGRLVDIKAFERDLVVVGSTAVEIYRIATGQTLEKVPSETQDLDLAVRKQRDAVRLDVGTVLGDKFKIIRGEEMAGGARWAKVVSLEDPSFAVNFIITSPVWEKVAVEKDLLLHSVWADYLSGDIITIRSLWGGNGVVTAPEPARFALHKIVLSTQREPGKQDKAAKDLTQGLELLRGLDRNNLDLKGAWDALAVEYQKIVQERLLARAPDLVSRFEYCGIHLQERRTASRDDENER